MMDGAGDALSAYLQVRQTIDGNGIFVPPGEAARLRARVASIVRPEPSAAAPPGRLAMLRREAEGCVKCGLHSTRRSVVFSDGPSAAQVMLVGEAPGAREDETGLPFVGRAGQLLDRLLQSVGMTREEVYICNVLKCRPPGNRNPQTEEIEQCSPYLRGQVALVEPAVIIALGTFAAQTLLGVKEPLGRLRGRTHSYEGVPLIPTYHPAALLRNPHWARPTWEDLQRVRRLLLEVADG